MLVETQITYLCDGCEKQLTDDENIYGFVANNEIFFLCENTFKSSIDLVWNYIADVKNSSILHLLNGSAAMSIRMPLSDNRYATIGTLRIIYDINEADSYSLCMDIGKVIVNLRDINSVGGLCNVLIGHDGVDCGLFIYGKLNDIKPQLQKRIVSTDTTAIMTTNSYDFNM